jgi:hypothetical protein
MKRNKPKQPRPAKAKNVVTDRPALPFRPAADPNRIDVTGITPEGIRIDPDITEGHPGYEESGESQIIPPERLARGSRRGRKKKAG